ncbi:hypothetical protein E3N88_20106 [Mikania micrantha]|uniref:Uncharacterized protein n=1 Tax=Mikania micrantha TaxID=192012 RepID=A0A5N6NHX4_9ASTR|nr:hypothetical protein E3N88_20106 [Mikania micrantha]
MEGLKVKERSAICEDVEEVADEGVGDGGGGDEEGELGCDTIVKERGEDKEKPQNPGNLSNWCMIHGLILNATEDLSSPCILLHIGIDSEGVSGTKRPEKEVV